MKQECIYLLQELTGKEYIIFTRRGNSSISNVLEMIKEIGKELLLIQDQGGWMTYDQYAEEHKLNCMTLKTKHGLVKPSELNHFHDAALLVNSMPAYSFLEDMESLAIVAEHNNILIINDASGSIGEKEAKVGDIIIGSFGKWKPINLGEGGFIATNDEQIYSLISKKIAFNPTNDFFARLEQKLRDLPKRLDFLKQKRKEIINLLKAQKFDIIMPDSNGLNAIARFKNEDEKQKILQFCKEHNLEYTECPRYIRVNEPAISIEIKRLDF